MARMELHTSVGYTRTSVVLVSIPCCLCSALRLVNYEVKDRGTKELVGSEWWADIILLFWTELPVRCWLVTLSFWGLGAI